MSMIINVPDNMQLTFLDVQMLLNAGETTTICGSFQYTINEEQGLITTIDLRDPKRQPNEYYSSLSCKGGSTLLHGSRPIANTTPRDFVRALSEKRIVVQAFNKNQFVIYEIQPDTYKFKRIIFDELYSYQYECYRVLGDNKDKPQVLIDRCIRLLGLEYNRVVDKTIFTAGYTTI